MSNNLIEKKISAASFFNCKDLSTLIKSIIKIYEFGGQSGSEFYLCEFEGVRFLVKVCFYPKTTLELHNISDSSLLSEHDAEIRIMQILKERVIDQNLSPCILEMVYSRVCPLDNLIPKKLNMDGQVHRLYAEIARQIDRAKHGLSHNKCAFIVLDKCDISLGAYIGRGVDTPVEFAILRSIIFLCIHVFYVITTIFPKFNHRDLHVSNVMLKFDWVFKFKIDNPKFLVFPVVDDLYCVPYFGIMTKIIDFGFSSIPEEGINSAINEDKEFTYYRSKNDLLLLFHWIYSAAHRDSPNNFKKIENLLVALDPTQSFIKFDTTKIREKEETIPSYREMLTNEIWDDYKKKDLPKGQIYCKFAKSS